MGFGHENVDHHSAGSPGAFTSFTCGHCGVHVSGAVVASAPVPTWPADTGSVQWVRCSNCGQPSAIDVDQQIHPGQLGGVPVEGLPAAVSASYLEARRCLSVHAYTACELLCRKILMHLAVDKAEGEPGDSFTNYVKALERSGYITPPMKGWVDLIRQHANEATHSLPAPSADRAEGTLMFTGELLRIVYEMDHLAGKYRPALADEDAGQQ